MVSSNGSRLRSSILSFISSGGMIFSFPLVSFSFQMDVPWRNFCFPILCSVLFFRCPVSNYSSANGALILMAAQFWGCFCLLFEFLPRIMSILPSVLKLFLISLIDPNLAGLLINSVLIFLFHLEMQL